MIHFYIIGVFPESVKDYLETSILKRAQEKGKIKIHYISVLEFLSPKERADDTPAGGGPGMVLKVEPFLKAVDKYLSRKRNIEFFFFAPRAKKFNQEFARSLAKASASTKHIVFLCGRYEGIDYRVAEALGAKPLSIGDFVITGGELAAAVVIDAVTRQIPGVLGDSSSIEETRVASSKVYTKPREIKYKGKTYKIPEVLLSGDHKKIQQWQEKNHKLCE